MQEIKLSEEKEKEIERAVESFPYFLEYIFPLSFKNEIVLAPHTFKWAERIQNNKLTATLSARKHLKSTTMYAYIMWRLFRLNTNERWYYMSYNQNMSSYHTENIKQLIRNNPYFKKIKDNTKGQISIDYEWDGFRFMCDPSGIIGFNRGWHGYGVVCDDILQDPTSELVFTAIDKINRTFFEQVMSLPIEGGELHLVGTAQHTQDLFFKLKDNSSWNWFEYKAIINETNQETLWPELFNYERLLEIRKDIGDKAFNREYQCSPVWSEDAYFKRSELMNVIGYLDEKENRIQLEEIKRPASQWKQGEIIAGVDIGKKSHPSHIAIFQRRNGIYTMIFQKFLDGWDYTKQIEFIEGLRDFYLIDEIRFDNTRGEFEPFIEQGIISKKWWKEVIFSSRSKFEMASNFSKNVNNKTIRLLNFQRMIDSILSVNNDLQAPETDIGHGDAFWSVALALLEVKRGGGYLAG